jgi:hypothetical protein
MISLPLSEFTLSNQIEFVPVQGTLASINAQMKRLPPQRVLGLALDKATPFGTNTSDLADCEIDSFLDAEAEFDAILITIASSNR